MVFIFFMFLSHPSLIAWCLYCRPNYKGGIEVLTTFQNSCFNLNSSTSALLHFDIVCSFSHINLKSQRRILKPAFPSSSLSWSRASSFVSKEVIMLSTHFCQGSWLLLAGSHFCYLLHVFEQRTG